jgi:hypothetical protein
VAAAAAGGEVAAVGAAQRALAEALSEVQGLLAPLRGFAPLVQALPTVLQDTAASVAALQQTSAKLREQQDAAKACPTPPVHLRAPHAQQPES